MNISPISFGRAVRVNSNKQVAQKIADFANASNYGDNFTSTHGKSMQTFAENIFSDVTYPNGKAIVVELSPSEIYVYSGKEAAYTKDYKLATDGKINQNKKFVRELPNRITRKIQEEEYGIKNAQLLKETQDKIRNMAENGINSRPLSTIDVELELHNSDSKGEFYTIKSLDYKSDAKYSHEHFSVNFSD